MARISASSCDRAAGSCSRRSTMCCRHSQPSAKGRFRIIAIRLQCPPAARTPIGVLVGERTFDRVGMPQPRFFEQGAGPSSSGLPGSAIRLRPDRALTTPLSQLLRPDEQSRREHERDPGLPPAVVSADRPHQSTKRDQLNDRGVVFTDATQARRDDGAPQADRPGVSQHAPTYDQHRNASARCS